METNAARDPMLELGTWVGRRQAFGLIASKCSAADAECLKRIRETRQYKFIAETWDEFCPHYLGLSRVHADRIIQQLEEFGTAYFELSQIVRIAPDAYRDISNAVTDHVIEYHGEKIPISKENGPRIAEVVRLLRRQHAETDLQPSGTQQVNLPKSLRALRKRLDACFTELEVIGNRRLTVDDQADFVTLIERSLERLALLHASAPSQ
jgi:hypothetical protein